MKSFHLFCKQRMPPRVNRQVAKIRGETVGGNEGPALTFMVRYGNHCFTEPRLLTTVLLGRELVITQQKA